MNFHTTCTNNLQHASLVKGEVYSQKLSKVNLSLIQKLYDWDKSLIVYFCSKRPTWINQGSFDSRCQGVENCPRTV